MKLVTRFALLGITLSLPEAAASADTSFSDGAFNPGDWTTTVLTHGGGGTFDAQQVSSGGNPGAFRRITISVADAPSPSDRSTLITIHLSNGAVYNPQSEGAIAAIDYSEDAILIYGSEHGQLTGLALSQGGNLYMIGAPKLITPDFYWTNKVALSLTATNFGVAFPTTDSFMDMSRHPDFSASGGPIRFGFVRANSTCLGCGGYSQTAGIDNWAVTVKPRPVLTIQPAAFPAASQVRLSWNSYTNWTYQVQCCPDLTTTQWVNWGSPMPGNGSLLSTNDDIISTQKFYRLVARP